MAEGRSAKWRRLGVFGDLPTRVLTRGLKSAPWFLEPVLVAGWTMLFFLLAGRQRRAVAGNLRALFPGWGRLRSISGAFRVFHHFAAVYVDALRVETGTGGVDWSIEGLAHFNELAGRTEGCLVLTAHMGNYDMAAPLFSGMFGRTVYAVRAPEREPEMQRIKEAELRRKEVLHPHFRTLYNEGGEMLGVELARLLREGMVVAVQGDRVVFEVSGMDVEVEPGLLMTLPRGPLMLARLADAPVYPLFILRDGWRRYRVKVLPRLELPPRRRGVDPGAAMWAGTMVEVIRRHWVEWSVFEPVFRRQEGGER